MKPAAAACWFASVLCSAAPAVAQALAEPEPLEVVVRAPPARQDASETRVGSAEARRGAGTQGDAIKSIQSLPGVARTLGGELVLWGSDSAENRIYIDGVELPRIYHGSAIRSVVPSDLLQTLTVVPGAYGPEHGRALGGIVLLETRQIELERPELRVGADLLDAGALLAAPAGPFSAVVAGRYGYVDRLLPIVYDDPGRDLIAVPSYYDFQVKAAAKLSDHAQLSVTHLAASDRNERRVPSSDPARSRSETELLRFHRSYARYRHASGPNLFEVVPFVGVDTSEVVQDFGGSPLIASSDSVLYGVRTTEQSALADGVTLRFGFDAAGTVSEIQRTGTPAIPPREGDPFVFGTPAGDDRASDRYDTHILDLAPHLETELEWGPLTLVPGARFDVYLIESSQIRPRIAALPPIGQSRAVTAFEPRLAVRCRLSDAVVLKAAAGRYHQPPDPADLSAVFGNPVLGLASATHFTVGESVELTESLSVDVTGFYKHSSELPSRSRSRAPAVGESLVPDGEGRSFGSQLFLRQRLERGLTGWLSVTLARSERKDAPDRRFRAFDFDQPYVIALVLTKQVDDWAFGTRLRYATGAPRTPVVGAFYDLRGDRFAPIFGETNTSRLPDFFQLDLRVDRRFQLGERARLDVYLDLLNVTFRRNAEEVVYGSDFTTRAYITGLPPLAVLGAQVLL